MQNKVKVSEFLYSKSAGEFVEKHLGENTRDLALKFSGKTDFPLPPVMEWLEALNKSKIKTPTFFKHRCFFTRRSFEQASSEATATYKASRLQGKTLLNLCGGIGVDDAAFSTQFEKVLSLDPDETVHSLAALNMGKLGLPGVERRMERAEDFLEYNQQVFDWIYADPDRRDAGKRLVSLADCSPDLIKLWPLIRQQSAKQLLKLSPLYPLEQLPAEIKGLEKIEIIAVQEEVKEVLAFYAADVPDTEPLRAAVMLGKERVQRFEGMPAKGVCATLPTSGYFYDLHAALAKADLGVSYAQEKGTHILIPNGLFQFSPEVVPDFMGRSFRIQASGKYAPKSFTSYLKEKGISKANFNSRFFHSSPEELKAVHRVGDGGDDYFFFFRDKGKQTVFVHGVKF